MLRLITTLVVAGVVFGSGLSTCADEADEKANKYVRQLRGLATRDDNQPGKPIVGINLMGSKKLTDEGLESLVGLKSITKLHLENSPVTDEGLKHIAGLKSLDTLGLSKTKITDAGLKEIAGLENLATLFLEQTAVTDAGLKELAKLKNLTLLVVRRTKVTKAGVMELQKALPNCQINK